MDHSSDALHTPIDEFVPELDRLAADAMAELKTPGAAIAVVQDGKVVLAKAYGQRDVEANLPVTTATQFVIASITKSFTATAVALLHHEGRLDWTKPIRDYLPEFRLHDPVATERLTILDVLTHQSGLPRHDWVYLPGDRAPAELLGLMRHLEPNRDFRTAYEYNNLGYNLIGLLIERVSGQSYEAFIRAAGRQTRHDDRVQPRRSRSLGRCRPPLYGAGRHATAGPAPAIPGCGCRRDHSISGRPCELDAAASRQGRVQR